MTTVLLVVISLFSLFFSLIFSSIVIKRKTWHQFFLSLSLFILTIHSITLLFGHQFLWYEWTIRLLYVSYVLLIPLLLGLFIDFLFYVYHPSYKKWRSLFYLPVIFFIGYVYYRQLSAVLLQMNQEASAVLDYSWLVQQIGLHYWLTGISSILFILVSVWLWTRKREVVWLWFALTGLCYYIIDQLLSRQILSTWQYSLLLFIFLVLLIRSSILLLRLKIEKSGVKK